MQEEYITKEQDNIYGELDLIELFNVLWQQKWIIVSVTAFISIAGLIYSLLLPNIYESKALLAPVQTSSGIPGSLRGYSNLAGLAGISLPTSSDEGNSVKAIKKINSLSFFEENILKNIFLPNLMAFKHWDKVTNNLSYDKSVYKKSTNTWIRDYSYPKQQTPSAQESYEKFKSEHLSLNEDTKSGFITISIKHQSPFIAKQWVEIVIDEINSFYRKKDKAESKKAVAYLNQQISATDLSEIKQVLAQLLQEETKKLALIEANQSYVFDYIDPPAVMEKKFGPRRALICIFSLLLGGILSITLVIMKHYVFYKKTI
jgi:LPS O-antigen subunit length determinant protein (WzzB/FepE family)